jgi:hypothetical protein
MNPSPRDSFIKDIKYVMRLHMYGLTISQYDQYVQYFIDNAHNIKRAISELRDGQEIALIHVDRFKFIMTDLFKNNGYLQEYDPDQDQEEQSQEAQAQERARTLAEVWAQMHNSYLQEQAREQAQEQAQEQEWEQEPDFDDDISPDLLERIISDEHVERADINAAYELCEVDDATKIAYYTAMLPEWTDITVFDVIDQNDVNIKTYITDPDNIVFVVAGRKGAPRRIFASTRDQVEKTLAVYECEEEYSMRRVFLPLNHIGAPFLGVVDYDLTKIVVAGTNYQLFFLRPLPDETCRTTELRPQSARLISHAVKHLRHSGVSDAHCQDGTERDIYQIHVPSFYK